MDDKTQIRRLEQELEDGLQQYQRCRAFVEDIRCAIDKFNKSVGSDPNNKFFDTI